MNGRPPVHLVMPWPPTVRAPASLLPFGPDDEPDHPGTDRLLLNGALLEWAEHQESCDACGDGPPLCYLGWLKLKNMLALGQQVADWGCVG